MTILQMCEWTTGETEIPIFHIDGKLNLADLLTKHHELSVDSVTMHSVWQTGLPWMRLDDITCFKQLTMAECYDKVMTGEFSQFNEDKVLLVHDQLKLDNSNEVEVMVECHDSKYETSHHITDFVKISDSSLSSVGSARVQVNLLVDPVLHG